MISFIFAQLMLVLVESSATNARRLAPLASEAVDAALFLCLCDEPLECEEEEWEEDDEDCSYSDHATETFKAGVEGASVQSS